MFRRDSFAFVNEKDFNNKKLQEEKERYLEEYEQRVLEVLSGKKLSWVEALFMPVPSYPSVLVYTPIKEVSLKILKRTIQSCRVDFYVRKSDIVDFEIDLTGEKLRLKGDVENIDVIYKEKTIGVVKVKRGSFSFNLYALGKSPSLWVSGKKRAEFTVDFDFNRFKEIVVSPGESNSAGLVAMQVRNESGARYWLSEESCENQGAFSIKASPYWVREWEERARKLWHLSIAIRNCLDLITFQNSIIYAHFKRKSFIRLSRLIYCSVKSFTHLRPSYGLSPSDGEWERGNWANGFLLGVLGLNAGIENDYGSRLRVGIKGLEKKSNQIGVDWLLRDDEGAFTTREFPPPQHWLRRSTNHGVVILASALVGISEIARLTGSERLKCKKSSIEKDFWSLLKAAFDGGYYGEGVRYGQFSLQEAIAYVLYGYANQNDEWDKYVNTIGLDISRIKECFSPFVYSGSAYPSVSWGDCDILPWKKSVINFLDSVPGDKALNEEIRSNKSQLYRRGDDEILKTEPLILATKIIKEKYGVCPKSIKGHRLTENKKTSSLEVRQENGFDWQLHVLNTPIHLTHNKDHDLSSFNLVANRKIVLGEVTGRSAVNHCVPGIFYESAEGEALEYNYYGSHKNGTAVDREYEGALESKKLSENGDETKIMVKAEGLCFEDGAPYITDYERMFLVLGQERPTLLIDTRYKSNRKTYQNFILPNDTNVAIAKSSKEIVVRLEESGYRVRIINNKYIEKVEYINCKSKGDEYGRLVIVAKKSNDIVGCLLIVEDEKNCTDVEQLKVDKHSKVKITRKDFDGKSAEIKF